MRRAWWLDRQPGWRVFAIAWGAFALVAVAAEIGSSVWVDAYHPGRPAVMPPLWLYPLDVLYSAIPAAVALAMHRARRAREN
jgi:hypothetical protein